jgi:hypothetical protein
MTHDIFCAVYTHQSKRYCDDIFFNSLLTNIDGDCVHVIDNSNDSQRYCNSIKERFKLKFVENLDIPIHPQQTTFHRKVTESVSYLRKMFLTTECKYFLIVESDVILTNQNTVKTLVSTIENLPANTGAVGALYYEGFHDYTLTGVQQVPHVLSGCTLYKRELIEKYPFRYDPDNLIPFPDAWICIDAKHEFSFYNNHELICTHAHTKDGTRYI